MEIRFTTWGNSPWPFFPTENGIRKEVTLNTTKIDMPILSMDRWHDRGHRTLLDSQDGYAYTTEKETNAEDPVINRMGVYFLKLFVHRSVLRKPEGFARQGAH